MNKLILVGVVLIIIGLLLQIYLLVDENKKQKQVIESQATEIIRLLEEGRYNDV